MGKTPDRHEGPLYEEGIYLEEKSAATVPGEIRWTGTYFSLYDGTGEYDPRTGGAVVPLHPAYFDVTLAPPSSEAFGTVSGLPVAPAKVAGFAVREQGVMVQSGLFYDVQVVKYNADGFDYRIAIDLDEWWPGPGNMTLRVQYIWSEQ